MSATSIPVYDVVAAAIRCDGAWLLGCRPTGSNVAGEWEFPGGKVEAGESHEAALARELLEELDVDVEVGERLATTEFTYPHIHVRLFLYAATIVRGTPRALWHEAIDWVDPARFEQLPITASNLPFAEHAARSPERHS